MGRIRQIIETYKLTAEYDKALAPLSILAFVVPIVGVIVAGLITKSIKIYIGLTNDRQGFADGSLASVSVAPVPVPAAGLLLLGGVGGLAAVRRKRKTA